MITKIESIQDESNSNISITFKPGRWGFKKKLWGVELNIGISPIFCVSCNKQLEHFYKLDGSRYGQVGTVECSCGAVINCSDADYLVDYLNTQTSHNDKIVGENYINFFTIYKLSNAYFLKIKEFCGLDLFEKYNNQTIQLSEIIKDILLQDSINITATKEFSVENVVRLPKVINQWFEILETVSDGTLPTL